MFVLNFYLAIKDLQILCSSQNPMFSSVLSPCSKSINQTQDKNFESWKNIYLLCGINDQNDMNRFVEYNIAIKKYFFGIDCKIDHFKPISKIQVSNL